MYRCIIILEYVLIKIREGNMEEQLAALVAQVAALEAKANTTNTMFAETYYYLTIH